MKLSTAIFVVSLSLLFSLGCSKTSVENNEPLTATAPQLRERCASQQVLLRQLAEDPSLAKRMNDIEELTASFIKNGVSSFRSGDDIIIPVWVNVLYNSNAENISELQISTQIKVLNEDFGGTNTDSRLVPALFAPVKAGNTKIKFQLAGITRKQTNITEWALNNTMKSVQRGGIDATNPATNLNMWCCNLGPYYLGYAQFPGGNIATDGVVIDDNAFGSRGTAEDPYGMGRTATHEIGHWLNLRHIWGDRTCGNDYVEDTPVAEGYNGGCPVFPKYGSCSATVPMMTMNYMDYTYDACMYMFTAGQNMRMQATFQPKGGRESFAQ